MLFISSQGALAGEAKRSHIRALQCAMRACLQKATTMRPNAIFFLLHCGPKPQNYGLVLASFPLLCNPGAISLSRVAFHMESENTFLSPPLKLPISSHTFWIGKFPVCISVNQINLNIINDTDIVCFLL